MKTTRQQILDFLNTKEIATASDIAQALHVTHANARHHLNNLEDEGLIQVTGFKRPSKRGRPSRRYRLSSTLLEHNLNELTSKLLNLLNSLGNQDLPRLIANRMTENIDTSNSKQTLSKKLQACILYLNDRHYKSRWEAHTNAPRIVFEHCPYRKIIDKQPELCQMDVKIIENLLGVPVNQTAKLEKKLHGIETCIFVVKK